MVIGSSSETPASHAGRSIREAAGADGERLRVGLPLHALAGVVIGNDPATGMAAKLLLSLGVNVVHVLRDACQATFPPSPEGDYLSSFLFRGMESIVVGAAPDRARSAIGAADIILHSDADADFLGLVADRLIEKGAIIAQATPWGERGPRWAEPSSELILQAAGGLVYLLGKPGRPPIMLGGHQAAYSTGMQLFTGIMIALTERDRSGVGQFVRTSYFETVAFLEWKGGTFYQADGVILERGRSTGPLILPTKDGHVAFYYRDIDWPRVVELFDDDQLRNPKFDTIRGRIAHEPELTAILEEHTRKAAKHELYRAAQSLGIPIGSVETIRDLLDSKQYAAQHFLEACDPADGDGCTQPSLPFTFNGRRFNSSDVGATSFGRDLAGVQK
ncbi:MULTISPECIES: CoA transferase [Bradyrhizobium]|uniref:CoA transferase n=1 Tax=Bradyrhizobium elkanii TaxID=29448 RepID=UPI0004143F24|nr:CoA transferase [Bradyrhizobium elkanii]